MIRNVKDWLAAEGDQILREQYINKNRNYYIVTVKRGALLLKWNKEPFGAAWKAGIKGKGMTVDPNGAYYPFKDAFQADMQTILFQWDDSHDGIYGLDTVTFDEKCKPYKQYSGEEVLVIAISDLKRMNKF